MLSTVLIIDTRKELSTKYKKCIESSETTVITARAMKEAFVALQNFEPDLIIISDSIEENLADFCQKIRALTYNTRPVIIALSKSADFQDRINVLENGADDFISEPVNIEEFKTRIKAHLRRDIESNLDTKTLLPNIKYTRKALKRVFSNENQAVLLAEIKNLDKYNSVYTEVAGDKLIQTFIAIIKSTLDESDFVGQIDEKNYIIITNKYSAEKLAEFITFAFDTVAPKFYSPEDAKRGYMMLKGERYAGMRVNFVSVEIGGILEGFNLITSVDTLLEKLHSIKNLAKIPCGSNYAIERTKLTGKNSIIDSINNKNIFIKENDESLNYLIKTTLELQGYDIQDELKEDSVVQPSIIILDSGNELEELETLKHLRTIQTFASTKFIVTSSNHNKSSVLDAGADLYLPKPYEISDLIQWVEYFMNKW